jgi:quercetin dioxygenase-like cupin family protein
MRTRTRTRTTVITTRRIYIRMARFEEAERWLVGKAHAEFYAATLQDAAERPQRNAGRKKIIPPEEQPWENSRQGLIKHLVNDQMNSLVETVDIYMQIIPPGSRSGKHRHLAEECLYVLEGRGYDIHVDCDLEITDRYEWKPQDEEKRFEWEAGDMIYVPPNTIHQHFNADPDRPARLVSATNRIYKYCGLNDLQQIEDAPEYKPGEILDEGTILKFLGAPVR